MPTNGIGPDKIRVTFQLSKAEKKALEKAAKSARVSLSDLIRRAIEPIVSGERVLAYKIEAVDPQAAAQLAAGRELTDAELARLAKAASLKSGVVPAAKTAKRAPGTSAQ